MILPGPDIPPPAPARAEAPRGAHVHASTWGWRHAGRKAWALTDIDLDLAPGERVLLLGASGAGKSTLMAGLAGLLGGEDEGEVRGTLTVDGVPAERARGRVGLVMQDPEAQVVLARIGDDVAFACENLGVPREEIWPRVTGALDAVGLDSLPLSHPTSKLSGGQKQRLALASVLAMRPGLLLLDEPTGNLDPEGVHEVRRATEAVLAATGATLVVVEHRVDVWADLVDRAVVVLGGRVVADGPVAEVLADEGGRLRASGIWLPGDERRVVEEVREAVPAPPDQGHGGGIDPAPPPPHLYLPTTPVISTHGLAVGYDQGHPVREDLDLGIMRRGSTCIVGGNGLGKTTLALTMAGLLPPLAGRVEVAQDLAPAPDRRDPRTWRSRELLGRLSMVFQEPEYQFVARTVREELEVGPRRAGLGGEELDALVEEHLEALALTTVALANPMTLSGGEKRRLSVASALISAPEVLILDEPTFGQDRTTWIELVRLLRRAVASGTTVVSITHDAAFVEAMGGHVLELASKGVDPRQQGEPAATGGPTPAPPATPTPPPDPTPARGTRPGDEAVAPSSSTTRRNVLLHVNPVTQFLGLAVMTTPLIISIDVLSAGLALLLELLLVPLTGIRLRQLVVRMVPVLVAAPLAALSMLLYATPDAEVYWSFGPATISHRSVMLACAILVRVVALGLPAIVLLSRIDPTDMADGLSQVLRLPARPVLAALAGIRMTGLMVGDWHALSRARRIRGIGDTNRFEGFFHGTFALLVFALQRASKLSLTMEARGFGAPGRRTWARASTVSWPDLAMMAVCVAIPTISLVSAWHAGVFQLLGR